MTASGNPTYRERIEQAVGGQDPVAILAETPGELHAIIARTPTDVLRARPFAGKWTPCEIIGHLVDAELVFSVRLRLTLAEEEPALPNWQQDAWVERQQYRDGHPAELAAQFAFLRQMSLPLWSALTADDLGRSGNHPTRGRETLSESLRTTAGHDLLHLDQLRRYIDAASQ
jgi:hypothetical protein